VREDSGCGVLYGVRRDSAYKLKQMAKAERQTHLEKSLEMIKLKDKGKPPIRNQRQVFSFHGAKETKLYVDTEPEGG
jgi:hypothetical protein